MSEYKLSHLKELESESIHIIREVAAETLPQGFSYEFSGLTREEQNTSAASTAIVFGLCLLFVYLLLSAQYESYILPLSVILSVPFGLMGSFIFAKIFGINNTTIMLYNTYIFLLQHVSRS